jgi:3-hydroxy-9,10-secoandrosta-1,3,5(10)-triene-9,17-dione monooxygenase
MEEVLLEAARALLPALRERAVEGDGLRRIPDQTVADFREAGFFRMLQPKAYGGLELEPSAFFDVQATIASACASSAWVLGVVAVHNWQLALFAKQAQDEVWGADSGTLISSSYAPTGKIERVDGGYRVRGRWSFSSGCDHCRWVFLGGLAATDKEGAPPEMRTFLLPRDDYRIDDNWHVAGLRATGSKDIVVEDAFVPEHRTHRLIDGFKRNSPGNEVNRSPLYRLPFGQIFVRSVSTSAIGIAQGALDTFREVARKRVSAGDGSKVAEEQITQLVCAQSDATLDEVRLVLHRNFSELMAMAKEGRDMPLERRLRFRYDSSRAVSRCVQVVDDLFTASGGRAIFSDSAMQRFFQDAHAARAHYANNPDKPARNWGAVQLGLKNSDYFV